MNAAFKKKKKKKGGMGRGQEIAKVVSGGETNLLSATVAKRFDFMINM